MEPKVYTVQLRSKKFVIYYKLLDDLFGLSKQIQRRNELKDVQHQQHNQFFVPL